MVKLLNLYTLNFKKTSFDPPIKLPEGVTLICGPNESGKSTILDAILYALYTRVTRPKAKPSVEQIIGYGKNHAIVRLDFSIGNKTYRIERQVYTNKPSTANLWEVLEEGQLRPMATGQTGVSEEVEKLLSGISFNEILASTVVAQKDLEHLVKQGAENRRKVINAFMNLESFNAVLDSTNEERKAIEGTAVRPGKLGVEQGKLTDTKSKLDEYNESLKQIEGLESTIKELEQQTAKQRKHQKQVDELFAVLKNYKESLDERGRLNSKIEGRQKLIDQLREQLKDLTKVESQLKQTDRELAKYSDIEEVEAKLEKVEALINKIDTASSLKIQREDDLRRTSREISELRKRLPVTDERKLADLEEKDKLVWLLAALAVSCFFASFLILASDVSFLLSALFMFSGVILILLIVRRTARQSKLRTLLTDIRILRNKEVDIKKLEKDAKAFNNQVKKHQTEILMACDSVERYSEIISKTRSRGAKAVGQAVSNALKNDKDNKGRLLVRQKDLKEQLSQKPKIEQNIMTNAKGLQQLKKELDEVKLPTLPKGVTFSDDLYDQTTKDKDLTGRDLSSKETRLEEKQQQLRKSKQFVEENKDIPDRLEKQTQLVRELEHQLAVSKAAVMGIEKTAEALRSRVKPAVEEYMGLILPVITDGRYKAAELDEEYNLKVWDPDAGEFKDREVFSGGTEDQFLLSMRLAFAVALLPEVKGVHPEFLFLDEPLGSSDDQRRQGIIQLLRTELSSRFKQIFLISHVGDLEIEAQNLIRLDNGQVTELITG
jgi:exonuclease SbcC